MGQKQILSPKRKKIVTFLVATELFTAKECARLGINSDKLHRIELSPKKTYFCCGARFQSKLFK